jgi:hypothetical protein
MLEIIHSGRQSGKTTKCVEWAIQNDGLILVMSYQERQRIVTNKSYLAAGLRPTQVITPLDIQDRRFRNPAERRRVVIDNLECLLNNLIGMEIVAATVSEPPRDLDYLVEDWPSEEKAELYKRPIGETIEAKHRELFPEYE